MDPIFCCLPNEGALVSSGGGVTLNGMTAGSDEVMELGEFDDDSIVVVLVERSFLEVLLYKRGLQWSFRPFL